MRIPRYAHRLDCMIFKYGFDRDVRDLSETLDFVSRACQQVSPTRSFGLPSLSPSLFGPLPRGLSMGVFDDPKGASVAMEWIHLRCAFFHPAQPGPVVRGWALAFLRL